MTPTSSGFFRRNSSLVAVLVLIILLGLGYFVYARYFNLPPAQVYIAQKGTAIAAVYGTVSIQSVLTLPVNAQNSGILHLDPALGTTFTSQGYKVKKDQLLCTITDEVTQRLMNQAHVDYNNGVARKKLGPPSAGTLKSAQEKLAAYQRLPAGPDGVPRGVAKVDFETARNDVARAQAAVDNESLETEHLIMIAVQSISNLDQQLKHAEVRSPIDGIVTLQVFNDGAYVMNTAQLFTVSSDLKFISGQVNEEDVGKLRQGMIAEIRLYAYGSASFKARLDAVLPTPDANSSRYAVTLTMENPPDNLLFGLTGEMNIILGRKENALIIPARALLTDQALIVDGGVVAQRTLQTDFKSLEFVEVVDGINEGDAVIVSDQDSFQPGERVRAVRTNAAGSTKGRNPTPRPAAKTN